MQRCAIYTRKSTEDGLEQDFNSLQAQREACEAYIKSQRHEGWKLVRTAFDDGGFSGGTMDRPALTKLLAAVERHEVDIIVVYKVDRLTRSLADFSKIIEKLDQHDVSFVSVTQAFNTTSSMGRLTLNVLLSFAQFEREVTAERIRDKIAASKKKGMWMGGNLPLGYDVVDRKLVINEKEATIVRQLFNLYIELGTVRLLKAEADRLGIRTKRIIRKDGSVAGGKPLLRGNLYRLLSNPLYVGLISHKGDTWPGMHKAIIDQETWDQVQQMMSGNRRERSSPTNMKAPFLLTGLVFDEAGEPLYQAQASKQGKRYRYYISKQLAQDEEPDAGGWRLPASTLEETILNPVRELLCNQNRLIDVLHLQDHSLPDLQVINEQAIALAEKIMSDDTVSRKGLLKAFIHRVELRSDSISIDLSREALARLLQIKMLDGQNEDRNVLTLKIDIKLQRKGVEAKLVIAGAMKVRQPDPDLCRLIAKARHWFDQLASREAKSVQEIASREHVFVTEISRVLPLAFLSPEIVEDILAGRHPESLTVRRLQRLRSLAFDWKAQRTQLGYPA
ncbi:recombinase family protein [uncultured Sneathiella sp.]|jgi:DNA invertase Pin-like site-specific DNA recombinase|uniref:recombinase family protein n=1 Tax=uncultured Sneathiella sp. TaxID=879315 RepID=UPI0030DDB594|tara:strand:- start:7187 stop:8869 length:1683 start_codon:yes stop_codon:yes gene_type:complete